MVDYNFGFKTKTRHNSKLCEQYIKGLLQSGKRNIERMCEVVKDSDYYQMQHFISESPWDAGYVMEGISSAMSKLFSELGSQVGLLIDESGFAKKGKQSVGVGKQYCGNLGKTENCQVAVFGALSTQTYYGLIDAELYLPDDWTKSKSRLQKAGVPQKRHKHKTKLELAYDIILRQTLLGTKFDYIGADGFYGNNYKLLNQIDRLQKTFVFDIHSNQRIYLEAPEIFMPKNKMGRPHSTYKTLSEPIKVNKWIESVPIEDWQDIVIRKGTKGSIKCKAICKKVYTWDGQSEHYSQRLLIVRRNILDNGDQEIKYILSNAKQNQYTLQELLQMQAQRHFVERAFQEVKSDIGASEYQVRGWLAWHHHIALCMQAQHFILEEKIKHKQTFPLLSAYDVRQIMIRTFSSKHDDKQQVWIQMNHRHKQRQTDAIRRYPT